MCHRFVPGMKRLFIVTSKIQTFCISAAVLMPLKHTFCTTFMLDVGAHKEEELWIQEQWSLGTGSMIAFQSSSRIRNTHFTISKVFTVTAATSSTGLPGKFHEPDNNDWQNHVTPKLKLILPLRFESQFNTNATEGSRTIPWHEENIINTILLHEILN